MRERIVEGRGKGKRRNRWWRKERQRGIGGRKWRKER